MADEKITIKGLCQQYNLSQTALANRFGIPLRTVQNWYAGVRIPPDYVVNMIEKEFVMVKQSTGHMLNVGDKVKMNIEAIGKGDLDGVEITSTGKNYWRYMNEHPNEIYTVTGLDFTHDSECIYVLSGFMGDNTWASDELIHVPEAKNPFETIKNMTVDEMASALLPLLSGVLKDGVPSKEYMKAWLLGDE